MFVLLEYLNRVLYIVNNLNNFTTFINLRTVPFRLLRIHCLINYYNIHFVVLLALQSVTVVWTYNEIK